MQTASALIGKNIEYSVNSQERRNAMVVDKVDMLDRRENEGNKVITGYMVKDETGNIDTIAYWRVKRELDA